MKKVESPIWRLIAHRWLVAIGLLMFLLLVLTQQITVFSAVMCSIVLLGTAMLAPVSSRSSDAVVNTAVDKITNLQDQPYAVLDVIPDPVMMIGPRGNLAYANKEFKDVFGAVPEGTSSLIRFRDPKIQSIIREVMEGLTPDPIEYLETKPFDRWFSVSARKVEFGNSKQLFMLHFHDLSETKHTEKVRSDFIANASHELRTPLASLTGFIETISGPARDDADARDRFLKIMLVQAERMSRLIDDLLTLSRFESGRGRSDFSMVNVEDVLIHVIDALKPMGSSSNISVTTNASATKQKNFVHGSRDELIQLFENLIENAIKYGKEDGSVKVLISTSDADGEVVIEVHDDGPGISDEHLPRLVERFYRVDVETSIGKQGTGLGLSIVRHIIQRHAGKLNIRSEVDKGSVFAVTLPLKTEVKPK